MSSEPGVRVDPGFFVDSWRRTRRSLLPVLTRALKPRIFTCDALPTTDGPSGVARHRAAGAHLVVGSSTPSRSLLWSVSTLGTVLALGPSGCADRRSHP